MSHSVLCNPPTDSHNSYYQLFHLLGEAFLSFWSPIFFTYSRLSIIRAWFNRFAAQPRQCIFKEKILFSVSITFV
jgi:hypothetical protein